MRRVTVVGISLVGLMMVLGGCHRKHAPRKSPGTPGVVQVLHAPSLVTTEQRGSATFTVVLGTIPTSDVTIPLVSSRPSEGTPGSAQLTFTSANWNVSQRVVVTGVDDSVADGPQPYAILLGPVVSDDPHYVGLEPAPVMLTNQDDDVASVSVSPTSGLQTGENGNSATFSVALTSKPAADVTLAVVSSDPACGTAAPSSLVFTAADWNIARIVTVTGVDDVPPAADGPHAYSVIVGPPSTTDLLYATLASVPVSVVRTDNDQAAITVSRTSGLVTSEAGLQDSFTVVLNTAPAYPVRIDVSTSNSDEGSASPSVLSFDSTNWMIPRTVTLTGINDGIPTLDGLAFYTVNLSLAGSTDPLYAALAPVFLSATNLDDDLPGIKIDKAQLVTSESGTADTLHVTLATIPSGPVTITITGALSGEGFLSTETLVFDPAVDAPEVILSIGKPLTVTGMDDAAIDGDLSYTLTGTAAGASGYDGLGFTVDVKNLDNDVPGLSFDRSSLTTNEAGESDVFHIMLRSIPTAPVTISLSGLNDSEGSLSVTSVVFDPATDDPSTILVTGKPVTVTGLDDVAPDGSRMYRITATPASDDPNYNDEALALSLLITNHDNDDAPPGSRPTRGAVAMELTAAPAWDDKANVEPSVLRTVAGWALWYEGSNGAGQKHEQVGRAVSPDGIGWTKIGTPVLSHSAVEKTMDRNGVGDPCVMFDSATSTYKMWFGARDTAAMKTHIGYATSADGVTWHKYPATAANPGLATVPVMAPTPDTFDAQSVCSPHVLQDGAGYKMWYQGQDATGITRIGYATSSDGISWIKAGGPVLDAGAAGTWEDGGVRMPCVVKDGSTYRMWYVGRDDSGPLGRMRLGYAQSGDGITWSKLAANPILQPSGEAGAWDEASLWSPWVVQDRGLFLIWYAGEDSAGRVRLGVTTSP